MATISALPDDPPQGPRGRGGAWAVAGGAALVLVLVVALTRGGGTGDERIRHLQALLPIPEGFPPGWFSLEFADGSLELMGPTGAIETLGEVVRFDGGELELGPNTQCDSATSGGLYDVTQDGDTVTFEAVGRDGCRPRQELLTAGPWQPYTPPPTTTRLPELRPAEVVATVPVPGQAAHLTVGDGSVWAATVASREIYRIDPTTNSVSAGVDVGYADQIPGLGSGDGSLWLTSWLRNTVTRIDARAERVTATIEVGRNPPGGVLVTDEAVWVANAHDGTVSRIDAATDEVTDTIEVAEPGDAGPQDVVGFGGQVLVSVPRDSEIAAIDPRTGAVSSFFSGRLMSRLAATREAVWAIEGGDATWVTRIGPDGTADLRVGVGERRHPQALAAADDVLWVVTTGEDSPAVDLELLRVDAPTGEVVRRSAVTHLTQRIDIVVDDTGDLWLTAADAVLRIDGAAD